MNILEALTLLKKNQNKTIRRKGNVCCTYTMDRGVIYVHNEEIWFFSVHEILADDWEVVDE